MKKTWILLFFCFAMGELVAQDWKKEPYLTKSLAGAGINRVVVSTSGGNISVQEGPNERAEVFLAPNNYRSSSSISREELKARLDEYYDLELRLDGKTLYASAKPKKNIKNWDRAVSVSFVVYVSSAVSTKLNTSGGNISISGLTGNQDFTTSGGNLQLERLKGTIKGRTSGGNITAKGVSDQVDLTTSGGNITVTEGKGTMTFSTSGGNVTLQGLDGKVSASTSGGNVKGEQVRGDLTASTSGGSIRFTQLRCALNASTSGGNIDVVFQELTGDIRLSNSGGSIGLTVPSGKGMDIHLRGSRVKTGTLSNFSGKVEEDEIVGKVNGGGYLVSAKGNGSVTLTMQ
jgi:DUF4097 and DUF4098 domain-containing protein YvlB